MVPDPRPGSDELWEPGPIDVRAFARPLEPEYLEAVRWVESLECNRPSQDKSWVLRVEENRRSYFSRVRPARGA